ncbi:MAG: metallophosphoesterase [Candidatus Ventricola sp.]
MNRRPNQSRNGYDSFSPARAAHFTASTPDAHFFETRKKRTPGMRLLCVLLAALAAVLAGNFLVNRFVRVQRLDVPIKGLTEAFDGYTILHLSDLKGARFGSGQQGLARALNDARFDAVAMTGDMVSSLGSAQALYDLIDQLRALRPDAPIYLIAGDRDPEPASMAYATGGSPLAPWVLGAQQRGAQLLSGPQAVTRGDQTLWLTAGIHLTLDVDTMQGQFEQQYLRALSTHDDNEIELAKFNLRWLEETRAARKAVQEGDIVVTLMHAPPDTSSDSPESSLLQRANLILCGHTLGGLLRLPGIGALFIPSQSLPRYGLFPGSHACYGLSREGHTWVHTSPGLGSEGEDYPPLFFRLFNPPTATLLTLVPSAL